MKLLVLALTTFLACAAFAQDARNSNDPDAIKTATAAEVKAKADQGATGIHELPYVKEEVERERVATEKVAAASKKASTPVQNVKKASVTKPSSTVEAEQRKETPQKHVDPKK